MKPLSKPSPASRIACAPIDQGADETLAQRKPYHRPALSDLGDLREVTLGGSLGGTDSGTSHPSIHPEVGRFGG